MASRDFFAARWLRLNLAKGATSRLAPHAQFVLTLETNLTPAEAIGGLTFH